MWGGCWCRFLVHWLLLVATYVLTSLVCSNWKDLQPSHRVVVARNRITYLFTTRNRVILLVRNEGEEEVVYPLVGELDSQDTHRIERDLNQKSNPPRVNEGLKVEEGGV